MLRFWHSVHTRSGVQLLSKATHPHHQRVRGSGAGGERLDAAFSRADAAEAADAGHMLKGALFNMGLQEPGASAKSIELAAKAGRMDEARALYEALRPLLTRF